MRQDSKEIAILIVNWNKKDQITELIKTIEQIHDNQHDIFVVDNASTDGSQEYIKDNFPYINLITNSINLGGTGGFNTGIRHILSLTGEYEYIWLLDNDAEITEGTLPTLIQVMKDKNDAGMVGSRIVDSVNRHLTVEVGAKMRTDSIGTIPNYRNMTTIPDYTPILSDYVAICSALVRISAIRKTCLMDQRMFIFWDDVDWGTYIKEAGFKIYACPSSIVYHPSYTERQRGKLNTFYYGVRNSILVYTKHMKRLKRYIVFYGYFRNLFKIVLLDYLNGTKQNLSLTSDAIKDYCDNRWGRYERKFNRSETKKALNLINGLKKVNGNKVLVIASDTYSNMKTTLERLKKENDLNHSTLLVEKDRYYVFQDLADDYIIIDKVKLGNIFYTPKILISIFLRNFDCSVSVNPGNSLNTYLLPFAYSTKRSYQFNTDEANYAVFKCDIYHIYKPVIAFFAGEILSFLLTPYIFFSGLKYEGNHGERT